MKTKKTMLMFVAALVLSGLAAYQFLKNTPAGTNTPALSPRSGGENASSEYLNAQKAAAYYRDKIQRNPDVLKNYIHLAQIFLQEGRVTGNNGEYIPKANALLSEVLRRDPENFEAIMAEASIAATLHQFSKARQAAERALVLNPHNAFAYGVLCDALVETGNYDEAVRACDRMMSLRPDLRSYARVSYLRELHCDVSGAIAAMKEAAEAGVSGQENRAWVLYNLGMLYFGEGRLDTAEYIFRGILQERPRYGYALSGLARVKSQQHQYDQAVKLYQASIASMNEPSFHEALGEVYEVMGNKSEALRSYDTAEGLYAREKESGEDNALETARFLALHDRKVAGALATAKEAIRRRPSIHGYETLALALSKNGFSTEAWDAVRKAMKLGTRDAFTQYLAGMIARNLGDGERARAYLENALAINPAFSLIRAAEAKTVLAQLGVAHDEQ